GRPGAPAAIERAIDMFAAEVQMDPAEVRRRNLLPRFDEPHTTPTGQTYDCGDYPAALERVLAAAGHDELRAEQRRRRQRADARVLGIGVATYVEVTAVPSGGTEFARVEVRPRLDSARADAVDGAGATGTSPHGQGLATAFAMLVADGLGIPLEYVSVRHGDTDAVPRGGGTMGSRSVQLGGSAVRGAAIEVVEQARKVAADL